MKMQRREFGLAVTSIIGALALPWIDADVTKTNKMPEWLSEFKRTGVLKDQTIILKRPLVINKEWGPVSITGCTFIASRNFRGKNMIVSKPGLEGRMVGCKCIGPIGPINQHS